MWFKHTNRTGFHWGRAKITAQNLGLHLFRATGGGAVHSNPNPYTLHEPKFGSQIVQ